jgi:hypothetical protein
LFQLAFLDGLEGREFGGARNVVLVMPLDLGSKQLVGLLPAAD